MTARPVAWLWIGLALLVFCSGTSVAPAQEPEDEGASDEQAASPELRDEELWKEDIPRLIAKLTNRDPLIVNEARRELLAIGPPVVPYLLEKLNDQDVALRFMVCELLGEYRDARAREPLLAKLADKEEYITSVAAAAARSLGMLGDRAVLPALREALESEDLELRYQAVRGLGILRDSQSAEAIAGMLDQSEETFFGRRIDAAAIEALGRLRYRDAAERIADFFRPEENEEVESWTEHRMNYYAARALQRIFLGVEGVPQGSLTLSRDERNRTIAAWQIWWHEHRKEYSPTDGEEEGTQQEAPDQPPDEEPGEQPGEGEGASDRPPGEEPGEQPGEGEEGSDE